MQAPSRLNATEVIDAAHVEAGVQAIPARRPHRQWTVEPVAIRWRSVGYGRTLTAEHEG